MGEAMLRMVTGEASRLGRASVPKTWRGTSRRTACGRLAPDRLRANSADVCTGMSRPIAGAAACAAERGLCGSGLMLRSRAGDWLRWWRLLGVRSTRRSSYGAWTFITGLWAAIVCFRRFVLLGDGDRVVRPCALVLYSGCGALRKLSAAPASLRKFSFSSASLFVKKKSRLMLESLASWFRRNHLGLRLCRTRTAYWIRKSGRSSSSLSSSSSSTTPHFRFHFLTSSLSHSIFS
mmetsp:Transcript_31713/g.94226  ORF Transcript_31713/g.94226 Transcript_31713/m.94226 type:complete len:235 (+) Transcript_31713:363-1067(+)